jgi:hypothetical protein
MQTPQKRRWVERRLANLRSGFRFPQPDFGTMFEFVPTVSAIEPLVPTQSLAE